MAQRKSDRPSDVSAAGKAPASRRTAGIRKTTAKAAKPSAEETPSLAKTARPKAAAKKAASGTKTAARPAAAKKTTARKKAEPKTAARPRSLRKATGSSAAGAGRKSAAAAEPGVRKGTLVVVESPTKAKSLDKMLGAGYTVKASVGHIMDLPKSRLAVDVDHGFEPEYILVRGKTSVKNELVKAAQSAKHVLLASDPDREGEAIAWHLARLLGVDPKSDCRIRMHQITRQAVTDAVASPGPIDQDLVDAQQARRVLDRLVGYTLSPLLWKKIRRGLSAGRVQSVALSILCDREKEIEAFVPQSYWPVTARASSLDGKRSYELAVERWNGESVMEDGRPMKIDSQQKADEICAELRRVSPVVTSFETKESARRAPAPFKTSTLQQEAARRLRYSPRRTMAIAQSLFEGVSLPGRGPVGLITYMRTDSLRFAPEALAAVRALIHERFGARFLPKEANAFQARADAQDAHEAIRPTDFALDPDSIRAALTDEQYGLYRLIWRRAVASQMTPAQVASSTLTAEAGAAGLKGTGSRVIFPGWGEVWPLDLKDTLLAEAVKGETLRLDECFSEAKQTRPPSRYTEAQLIKVLEDKGIGRPSTYASIVETLYDRDYARRDDDRRLEPSPLGRTVEKFLKDHFDSSSQSPIMETDFTAHMEESLDSVESGQKPWRDVLGQFWKPFLEAVAKADEAAPLPKPEPELTGENCPECGRPLVKKRSRFGEFIGCSGYPECKYIKPPTIGVPCPKCGASCGGEVVKRRSKKGRTFYSCSRYPDCDFVSWNRPAGKKCPSCGTDMVYMPRARKAVCPACGAKDEEDS